MLTNVNRDREVLPAAVREANERTNAGLRDVLLQLVLAPAVAAP
jgi:hypothetical protein